MQLDPPLLRAARAVAGLSQKELAAAAGVHPRAVAGWELGEYQATEEKQRAVIAALEQAGVRFLRDGSICFKPKRSAHG